MRVQLDRVKALYNEARNGIAFRIDTMTAEEDRVAVVVESYAEFAEQGIYNNLYHFLFRIVDGRITRIWVYYDTALANRVLRGEGGTTPVESHASD
jgi:ketosteroid isomerase-like protein